MNPSIKLFEFLSHHLKDKIGEYFFSPVYGDVQLLAVNRSSIEIQYDKLIDGYDGMEIWSEEVTIWCDNLYLHSGYGKLYPSKQSFQNEVACIMAWERYFGYYNLPADTSQSDTTPPICNPTKVDRPSNSECPPGTIQI